MRFPPVVPPVLTTDTGASVSGPSLRGVLRAEDGARETVDVADDDPVDRCRGPHRAAHRPARRALRPRELPPGGPAACVSSAISTEPYPYRARILFHAPAAVQPERTSPTAGRLEPIDDKSCTGSTSLPELALHIAVNGIDFEVLEPPELIPVLREVAGRLMDAADSTERPRGARPTQWRTSSQDTPPARASDHTALWAESWMMPPLAVVPVNSTEKSA